jgi:hypothetical protein
MQMISTTCHQSSALWFSTSATARVSVKTWLRLAFTSRTPYVWSLQIFGKILAGHDLAAFPLNDHIAIDV